MARAALRIAALIVGVIGTFDGIVVNTVVSIYHDAAKLLNANVDQSHGWIGLLLCIVGFVGAVLAVRFSIVATILMLIAGIGFFFVVHWWALLASPQWIVGAVLSAVAFTDVRNREAEPRVARREPPMATT